ncbi:PRC-barrel domain containing protein [Promicromonospora sp. NPDC059942]|uniref:PRC-barrel domain containing protein n=1 Tax=Promicromonospora sp. NPDC059942 TaxID=3347009 RepID=UPI0036494612
MNVGDLLDASVVGPDGATLGVVVDVRLALELVDEPDDQRRDREDPEPPLSAHVAPDAVGGARLVGLLVSPHSGGSFLGYERTKVRSPWPIAQLVRRRHRGTFLVDWADVAEVRTSGSPVVVRLVAGFTKGSPELGG